MADGLGGHEIDDQLEVGRLLNGNVARSSAAQYLHDHPRPLPVDLGETRPVTKEPALFRHVGPLVYRRQAHRSNALDDYAAIGEKQG